MDDDGSPPLLFTRLRRLATPLGILLAGLLVVTLSYQGPLWAAPVVVVAVAGLVMWLRQRRDDEEGDSTGAGDR